MNRYSAERKESVMQKMMPPHNIPISRLAEETGISDVTLYNWRKQARVEGVVIQPLVQHAAQTQWVEVHDTAPASYR